GLQELIACIRSAGRTACSSRRRSAGTYERSEMKHMHAVTRDDEPEAGFTLIELMMVVLIIAILIAVMIPTFVGAKQRAQDRAMQSGMRNALTAAKVIYSDHGDYTEASTAGLAAVEPSLSFVAAGSISPGPNVVSVNPASAS